MKKVLLSLAVALIVAASEAILYLIWDSRRSQHPQRRRRQARPTAVNSKKDDTEPLALTDGSGDASHPGVSSSTALSDAPSAGTLRERTTTSKQS